MSTLEAPSALIDTMPEFSEERSIYVRCYLVLKLSNSELKDRDIRRHDIKSEIAEGSSSDPKMTLELSPNFSVRRATI